VGGYKDVADAARIIKAVRLIIRVNVISSVHLEVFGRSEPYYKFENKAPARGEAGRRRKYK
jgi:hypothetical protein